MEQKKLSAQIAGNYPKAEVLHSGLGVVKMLGVNWEGDTIRILTEKGSDFWLQSDTCRLLLKPLPAISENDAIEVAKIDDKNCDYRFGNNRNFKPDQYKATWNGKTMFVERYHKGRYITGDPIPLIPALMNIEQIDFLRSRGYDLSYGSIPSLISAGIAIDSTTFKK